MKTCESCFNFIFYVDTVLVLFANNIKYNHPQGECLYILHLCAEFFMNHLCYVPCQFG